MPAVVDEVSSVSVTGFGVVNKNSLTAGGTVTTVRVPEVLLTIFRKAVMNSCWNATISSANSLT